MVNWIPLNNKIEDLTHIALRGKLVLFVGAGVSKNSKFPDWPQLLNKLLVPWPEGQKLINSTSPLKLLETYVEKFLNGNPAPLKRKIANILLQYEESSSLSAIHKQIGRIPFSRVYTTNYDTLLNKVFLSANSIFSDEHFADSISERDKLDIIHLHGCIRQPLGMRVTWKDFRSFWRDKEFLRKKLELDLHDNTFFFLGYSFRDPHLEDLLREFPKSSSVHLPKHYVVFISPEEPSTREEVTMTSLQSLNIHSLVVKSVKELENCLNTIAGNADIRKKEIIRGIDATTINELSKEISRHIKEEDLRLIATYHENGQYEEAVTHIDKLLTTMYKLAKSGLKLDDDICFLLAKKVFYLGYSQKREEAKLELETNLENYPTSPWLIAEVIRDSIKSERDIDETLSELSRVPKTDRQKVVLFDIFEISLLIRKTLYAEAEDKLKLSSILNTQKYQIHREMLKAERLLARRDLSLGDPAEAAKICSALKEMLADKSPTRTLTQAKNEIREIYSRSVLNYVFVQPPAPLFSERFNPFEDFKQPSYLEILEGANECVKALLKVTKDAAFRDAFIMRRILFEDELGEQADRIDLVAPKLVKESSSEVNSIIEALVKSKEHLFKGEFQDIIKLMDKINWRAKIKHIPLSLRLLLGWRECFALGRMTEIKKEAETNVIHMSGQAFSDCQNGGFIELRELVEQLFMCSYRLGCFEDITKVINDIRSLINLRPFSLFWLKTIEEVLSHFIHEGVRTKQDGFVKYISLMTEEEISYEPFQNSIQSNKAGGERNRESEARAAKRLLTDIVVKKYELLPSRSNLLNCTEMLLQYDSPKSCWRFLTDRLSVDWDHLFSWAEKEFPKKSQAARICYYLGKSSPDKAKAESALKTSGGIADNLGMKSWYAETKFALGRFYLKEGRYQDAKGSLDQCIGRTENAGHFLQYAAFLLSENDPKRAWEVLQKGREVIGKDDEFAQLLFNIGFRMGGDYEREAMLIMQKHPKLFNLQQLDLEQDRDREKVKNWLREGRERDERLWELYLWGKMPLIAVAKNIRRSFTNLWLDLTDVKRVIMFRWPNPQREAFELRHSNSKEVVMDISSLFAIVKLGIQDKVITLWNKIIISKSLWNWTHNEILNTQQQYMEERHKSYQNFRDWLGEVYDDVPTMHDFWQSTGKTIISQDAHEMKALGNHVVTLSWARFKKGLWLVMYGPEQSSNIDKWERESKDAVLSLYQLFHILERLGEISEPEKTVLVRVAKEKGISEYRTGSIEQRIKRKQVLLVDYYFFGFAEHMKEKEGVDLLQIINRCFKITISPLDLDLAKEELDKHNVAYEACNVSVKVRDVLRGWKQIGKLELQDAQIRKDNSNEFVSAEQFGVPWTEMAIAVQKQIPFIVDDLATFEMFEGFMKDKPHPSSGIPLIILQQIENISDGDHEELDYWYGRINKLWQMGTFGMPFTGVLKWALLATNLNINSKLVTALLSSLTKHLEATWPSQKLISEDFAKVGITFKKGIPDPLMVGRLSLHSYLKEVSHVIISSNIDLFINSMQSHKIKVKYPSTISKELYSLFEEQIYKLESKIIEKWQTSSDTTKKEPKQGDLLKLLPLALISNGLISRPRPQINIGLEGNTFLCHCIKTVFETSSSLYSSELKGELLYDAFAGTLIPLIDRLKETFDKQKKQNTPEIFIDLLVNISFFLERYIIVLQDLRLKLIENNRDIRIYLSKCYDFIIDNPVLPFAHFKDLDFLEYESLRNISLGYFLHLSSAELSSIKPSREISDHLFESLTDMCNKAEAQKAATGKDIQVALGRITQVLNALPDSISQDFLKQNKSLLTEIGFQINMLPTPAAEIEKKLIEIGNSLSSKTERFLEPLGLESPENIREKAQEEMSAWIREMMEAFDNYDDIKQFLADIMAKTAIPSESQPIIYNALARLYLRSQIKDEAFKKLVADAKFRSFVKTMTWPLPKPNLEQEILEVLIIKLIVPVTLADLIEGVLESPEWFSKKLVSVEWKSAYENYGIILRGACLIVSYELCEAAFEKSALFENIITIGQQITNAQMASIFLRETRFLLAILKGDWLAKLTNVRRTVEEKVNEAGI